MCDETNMKKIVVASILLLLTTYYLPLTVSGWLSTPSYGYPGEYLVSLSGGAKGMGMGFAQTSIDGQSNLMYSNPASLASLWWQEASISVTPLFFQSQFIFMSYGYPVNEKHSLGFGMARLTSGDAEKTNEFGETLGSFSDQQSTLYLNYSRKQLKNLYLGANLKFVSQDIDNFSAKGFGLDAGLIYYAVPTQSWAVNFLNLIPPRLGPDTFPMIMKLGFCRNLFYRKLSWATDLNFVLASKSPSYWNTGVEYNYTEWFKARFGLNNKQVAAGFGISTRQIDFDYAFAYHPLDFLHSLTINIRYGLLPTSAESKIAQDLDNLAREKKEHESAMKKEADIISFERERLKKETRLATAFMDARIAYETKDYRKSKNILKDILEQDQGHTDARRLMSEINNILDDTVIQRKLYDAKILYQRGLFTEAVKNINYILELQPDHQEARILGFQTNAQLYLIDRKYNDAKGELIEILKINPNNLEATQLLKRVQTIMDIQGE